MKKKREEEDDAPESDNPAHYRSTNSPLALLGMKAGYNSGTQRAEVLGIAKNYLYHLESGGSKVSPRVIDLMAEHYKRPATVIERAANICRHNYLRRATDALARLG